MLTVRVVALSADPVLDWNFPDPGIVRVGATYYGYASNSAPGDCIDGEVVGPNVQVATSPDLRHWTLLGDALPTLPPWAIRGATWAPHPVALDGSYRLYFAARHGAHGALAIGVAVAQDPAGPFAPLATPLVDAPAAGGVIDPYVFRGEDGTDWLLWKNDGNSRGLPTWIYIQRLAPDGLSLVGAPFPLIRNDQPWEGEIIEAPTLCYRNGEYHLLYSANACTDDRYGIGHAGSTSLLGPYAKSPGPVFRTSGERIGPGGQDIVEIDGRTWLVSHGWDPSLYYRRLYLDELCWEEEVTPIESPPSAEPADPGRGTARLRPVGPLTFSRPSDRLGTAAD
jgi:arabinan endo-1,5-alpha-L-arabinosidase